VIPYISNTDNDVQAMLKKIGVASIDDLFCDIKPRHKPKSFDLPEGKSEFEVVEHLKQLAPKKFGFCKIMAAVSLSSNFSISSRLLCP